MKSVSVVVEEAGEVAGEVEDEVEDRAAVVCDAA